MFRFARTSLRLLSRPVVCAAPRAAPSSLLRPAALRGELDFPIRVNTRSQLTRHFFAALYSTEAPPASILSLAADAAAPAGASAAGTGESPAPAPPSQPEQPAQAPKTYKSIQAALHAPVYRAVTEKCVHDHRWRARELTTGEEC